MQLVCYFFKYCLSFFLIQNYTMYLKILKSLESCLPPFFIGLCLISFLYIDEVKMCYHSSIKPNIVVINDEFHVEIFPESSLSLKEVTFAPSISVFPFFIESSV